MRPWIEHLLTNSSACDDFLKNMQELVDQFADDAEKATLAMDQNAALRCMCQRHMYKELKKRFQGYQREQISQAHFRQTNNIITARKE
jgi:hypothetical protein